MDVDFLIPHTRGNNMDEHKNMNKDIVDFLVEYQREKMNKIREESIRSIGPIPETNEYPAVTTSIATDQQNPEGSGNTSNPAGEAAATEVRRKRARRRIPGSIKRARRREAKQRAIEAGLPLLFRKQCTNITVMNNSSTKSPTETANIIASSTSRSLNNINTFTGYTNRSIHVINRTTDYIHRFSNTINRSSAINKTAVDYKRNTDDYNRMTDGLIDGYSKTIGACSRTIDGCGSTDGYSETIGGHNETIDGYSGTGGSNILTGDYKHVAREAIESEPVAKIYKSEDNALSSYEESPSSPRCSERSETLQPDVMCKMAIVLENYPDDKLTEEQATKIQQAILKEVWKCAPGTGPQFRKSYADKGAAFITCANESAQSWLMESVPKLQPWKGAVLKVALAKDILGTTEVVVWVPTDMIDEKSPKKLLSMMETQNVGLKTEDWRLVSNKVEHHGVELVLEIGDEALKTLKNIDFKPFLGFTQLNFKVVGRRLPEYAEGKADKPSAY